MRLNYFKVVLFAFGLSFLKVCICEAVDYDITQRIQIMWFLSNLFLGTAWSIETTSKEKK